MQQEQQEQQNNIDILKRSSTTRSKSRGRDSLTGNNNSNNNLYSLEKRRRSSSSSSSSKLSPDKPLVLHFREVVSLEDCLPRSPMTVYRPDAYLICYSVSDRDSFDFVKTVLKQIDKWEQDIKAKAVIIVANKTDLVRSRVVSKQGESPNFSATRF